MPRDVRETTRPGHHGIAAPARHERSSQGDVDVAPDMDVASVLARLTSDLERFEAAMAIERRRIEHPMPFEQPARHSERISSTVTALVAELLQILGLLRRLRESDEQYSQPPPISRSGPQPSRQGKGPT